MYMLHAWRYQLNIILGNTLHLQVVPFIVREFRFMRERKQSAQQLEMSSLDCMSAAIPLPSNLEVLEELRSEAIFYRLPQLEQAVNSKLEKANNDKWETLFFEARFCTQLHNQVMTRFELSRPPSCAINPPCDHWATENCDHLTIQVQLPAAAQHQLEEKQRQGFRIVQVHFGLCSSPHLQHDSAGIFSVHLLLETAQMWLTCHSSSTPQMTPSIHQVTCGRCNSDPSFGTDLVKAQWLVTLHKPGHVDGYAYLTARNYS